MTRTTAGAPKCAGTEADNDVAEGFRRLYDEAREAAERDALELLRCCRMRAGLADVEDASRAAALSASRLAAFAVNLARATAPAAVVLLVC